MVLAHHYNIRGAKSKPDEGPIALGRLVKIPFDKQKTGSRRPPIRLIGTHELFAFALFSFQRTRLHDKSGVGHAFRAALRELDREATQNILTLGGGRVKKRLSSGGNAPNRPD